MGPTQVIVNDKSLVAFFRHHVFIHATLINFAYLHRWLEGINSEPGLNISMITALAKKRSANPEDYTQ